MFSLGLNGVDPHEGECGCSFLLSRIEYLAKVIDEGTEETSGMDSRTIGEMALWQIKVIQEIRIKLGHIGRVFMTLNKILGAELHQKEEQIKINHYNEERLKSLYDLFTDSLIGDGRIVYKTELESWCKVYGMPFEKTKALIEGQPNFNEEVEEEAA